jgi:hypothetical protein
MGRVLIVLAAAVVVLAAFAAVPTGAVPTAKAGRCVAPQSNRDYVPYTPDDLQNGPTHVDHAFAVRVSNVKSYTAARFVGGAAEGKIGTWGVSAPQPGVGGPAFGLDRNARRWSIQGLDLRLSVIARNFGLRASDPAAKKARECVRDAAAGR